MFAATNPAREPIESDESVVAPAVTVPKRTVPKALKLPEMVVEPVMARAVEVAPVVVRPPLNAICVVVALLGKR